jgi:hypothetical protein
LQYPALNLTFNNPLLFPVPIMSIAMKYFVIASFLLCTVCRSVAQVPDVMLYIRTDRDVYAPTDAMNFTAYMNSRDVSGPTGTRLFVCLQNPSGKVVADTSFAASNDRCTGALILPDSLADGEYRILSYTAVMEKGRPEDIFTRKIFIRKNDLPGLVIRLTPDAPFYRLGETARLDIHIGFQNRQLFNNDRYSYLACKDGVPFMNGTGTTDATGKSTLEIRIPADTESGLITVAVSAEYRKYHGSASILLPADGMPVFLNFFPEGGTFIDGLETKVGFRAQDFQGEPLDFEGLLLDQDDQPVDTIRGGTLGIGSFTMLPDRTDPLKVRITHPSGISRDIPLPGIKESGIQMILQERTSTFLGFFVRTTFLHANQPLTALAESGGSVIFRKPLVLDDTISFRVPVEGIREGVFRVSLVSKNGTTLAQRCVFFTPPAMQVVCKNTYAKGNYAKINTINLSVLDPARQPVNAGMSIAVVDDILSPDWNHEPDIRTWFLLGQSARALPPGYFSGVAPADSSLLDDLMLARIDTTVRWNPEISARVPAPPAAVDFRSRLLGLYQPKPFEKLVARFHKDRFVNEYLTDGNTVLPSFIKRNMADLEELGMIPAAPTIDDLVRRQLQNGVPVLSVLRMVKAYTLIGDRVFFRPNKSISYPKGALFLIDGIVKGNSISVLDDFSPQEFTGIKVSLASSEILKYDGEAEGLILLTSKRSDNYSDELTARPLRKYNPTLYWNPEVKTTGMEPVQLAMPDPALKSLWRVVITGVDKNGNYFESVLKKDGENPR